MSALPVAPIEEPKITARLLKDHETISAGTHQHEIVWTMTFPNEITFEGQALWHTYYETVDVIYFSAPAGATLELNADDIHVYTRPDGTMVDVDALYSTVDEFIKTRIYFAYNAAHEVFTARLNAALGAE